MIDKPQQIVQNALLCAEQEDAIFEFRLKAVGLYTAAVSKRRMTLERRQQPRIASTTLEPVTVSFSGEFEGTGKLYDVSRGGCKIDSRVTPPLGASLTLRLSISDHMPPLVIDTGIVGWTIKQKYFGVKFLTIKPSEQAALDRYLATLHK